MSYMDRKNILSEGFFDSLKKFMKANKSKNYTRKEKQLMRDPEFRKHYQKLEKSVDELGDLIKNLKV